MAFRVRKRDGIVAGVGMEGRETANGNNPVNVLVKESRGIAMWKDWPGALDRAGMPLSL